MKKVMITGVVMLFSFGIFAQSNTSILPKAAQDFIGQHFASVNVVRVEENSNWQIWEDEKYEVKLANGIELDFDENGNIIEMDSKKNESIPEGALPSNIGAYIKANYPNAKIVAWEKDKKGHEVELADGTDLEFNQNGNFLKID